MADKFEDLRTYVTVADAGGISAGAASLGIAKSAVSRRLGELEARIGATLVTRTTRSFALTDAGRVFLRGARSLLADLEELETIGTTSPAPPLTILAPPFVHAALLRALSGRLGEFPPLRLLTTCDEDGRADVEFALGTAGVNPAKGFRMVAALDAVACASPSYLAKRGPASATPATGDHEMVSIPGLYAAPGPRGAASGRVEAGDVGTATAAAMSGAGLALLPTLAIRAHLADGTLIAVPTEKPPKPRTLLARVRQGAPEAAMALVDAAAQDFVAQSDGDASSTAAD